MSECCDSGGVRVGILAAQHAVEPSHDSSGVHGHPVLADTTVDAGVFEEVQQVDLLGKFVEAELFVGLAGAQVV